MGPEAVWEVGPEAVWEVGPEAVWEVGPEAVWEVGPEAVWEVGPEAVWEVGPEAVWEVGPEAVWEVGPEAVWEVGPEAVWEVGPEAVWEVGPEAVKAVVLHQEPEVAWASELSPIQRWAQATGPVRFPCRKAPSKPIPPGEEVKLPAFAPPECRTLYRSPTVSVLSHLSLCSQDSPSEALNKAMRASRPLPVRSAVCCLCSWSRGLSPRLGVL